MGFRVTAVPQPTLARRLQERSVADETDNVLFREIEDELRQERAKKLWKNYGRYIIATAVALVIGVAGYQGWRTYDISSRTADGERFAAALKLAADNHSEQAATAFANISQDAGSGYAMLSRFREAGLLVSSGDLYGAARIYQALADDSEIEATYRDLAVILGVLQEMNQPGGGHGKLIGSVAALNTSDNPWRHSAREILAFSALQGGNRASARNLLSQLANDATAPAGVRTRSAEMLAIVGN